MRKQIIPANSPGAVTLKKGDLLFSEGENSHAMYYLKTGMIRIFKKKSSSFIEIATIHSGQIVGELAFLDGQTRSASGEALTRCELIEISGTTFTQTMKHIPDWLKLLLKTIVGRLRTASTRIRQLEQASTAFDYSSRDGRRQAHYVYLSPTDVLKVSATIILVAARNGKKSGKSYRIRVGLLQRYGNHIMGVPIAKITDYLDVLSQVGCIQINDTQGLTEVDLLDIDFLENFIAYYNEENLKDPTKRHDMTLRAFFIMSLIAKHLKKYPIDEKTGLARVNIAEIHYKEEKTMERTPFRMEEFPELVELGYATPIEVKNADQAFTNINVSYFKSSYRNQRLIKAIQALNEKKSSALVKRY